MHDDTSGWWNQIYNADARDMRQTPDASVSLVVTSPPYNVAKGYTDHNDDLSLDEYLLSAE